MIRLRLCKVALTLCALLLSSVINAETIHDRLSLTFSDLRTMPVEMDGKNYVKLIVDKLPDMNRSVGNAELPCEIRSYIVPENDNHFKITITRCDSIVYPLLYSPYICQEPVTTNDTISNYIHNYEAPRFPTSPVEIINDGYLFGNNHIIDVRITPFIYEINMNRVLILTNIQYTITTSSQSESTNIENEYISKKAPIKCQSSELSIPESTNNTFNIRSVSFISSLNTLGETPLVGNNNLPAYQYMVVTNRELAPAFDRIIALKRQKGYNAGVVLIEDILSDSKYSGGDLISHINDDAGKLRAFLSDASSMIGGTQYVLLGGGPDIIPIRYAACNPEYTFIAVLPYKLTPTDLYYSDFNGNWDSNNNKRYGEYSKYGQYEEGKYEDNSTGDLIDYYPEIFVGRLLCKSKEEVDNYTYKLLKYELNPGNGDFSYLRNGFFIQSDQTQANREAQDLIKVSGDLFDYTKYFEEQPSYYDPNPTFPTGNDVVAELNSTKYGFFSPHGHGNPFGVATKSRNVNEAPIYGIISQQCVPDTCHYHVDENAHGLDMIDNADYPMILYSMSCDLTPFDTFKGYKGYYNMGESFTVGGHYGGPAFIGNTRVGWIYQSWRLERAFIETLTEYPQIGIAQSMSKVQWQSVGRVQHHCRLTSNLIGCPEFSMWTKTPTKISYTLSSEEPGSKTITIPGEEESTVISQIRLSNRTESIAKVPKNGATYNINNTNYVITLSKPNKLPEFFDLKLRAISTIKDGYYFVKNLIIGDDKISTYVIFRKCNLTLNASGNIDLFSNITFNGDSNVTLISKGVVNVYGGKIKAGAKVKIIAPDVIFHNRFECEDGAELLILSEE